MGEQGSGFATSQRPLVPLLGPAAQAHDADVAEKQGAIEGQHLLGAAQGEEVELWGSSPPAAPAPTAPPPPSPPASRPAPPSRGQAARPPRARPPAPEKPKEAAAEGEGEKKEPEGLPAYKWTRV
jgi:hypothetical protein